MKTLIIKQLEKKLGNTELMKGTDVLKIPLAMVLFLTSMHKSGTPAKFRGILAKDGADSIHKEG